MFVDQLDNPAAATRDARQRIVSNYDRQSGFFHQQFVDIAQQCAATGQDDATIGDIGAQFRRRLLQRFLVAFVTGSIN